MCEIFSTKLSNQRPYACRIAGSTCKLVGNVFSLFNKQNYYLLFWEAHSIIDNLVPVNPQA